MSIVHISSSFMNLVKTHIIFYIFIIIKSENKINIYKPEVIDFFNIE